ncbi:MAG TPA: DUF1858 domain-containing protein [Bacteroidales bacterium]|nr:DUF1858 domain-containing protein [Bacteroidales bacterium]HOX78880.1 DUF1858 domain-containing protein [Bacteroidales bacterium]HPI85885.1 DUF1858 domain-containing protein [Bacteroidales bacterium]HPM92065.1 DUF1858 domain-containing protein [Bacteroidales bacterium]
MEQLIITPRTKVYELLEAYPQLEDTLIEIAPVFKKLKNPVLRRTIARVTTLQQAAQVGQVPVHEMVNTLRQKVGLDRLEGLEATASGNASKPSWLIEDKIVKRLDARPVIEQGGHPLGEVLTGVGDLKPGEIYELVTPFLPAPLIERVVAQGFDHWSDKKAEDHFINYFLKK